MWKGLLLHIKAVTMNKAQYWGGVSAVVQGSCEDQKGGALVNGLQFLRMKIEFPGGVVITTLK